MIIEQCGGWKLLKPCNAHTHAKQALIPEYAQKPMYTLYEDCWGEVPLERVVQLGGQPTIIPNQY